MSAPARQVVTVQLEGLSLSSALATYQLFLKLARQYGISDVYEVECSLTMSTTAFGFPQEADAAGLLQALEDLRIDAQVTEVTR